MSSLNIVMIGPKGAGKTSILSVMLHDIQQFIQRMDAAGGTFSDLAIKPSLEAVGMAHGTLSDGYAQLNKLAVEAKKSPRTVDMSVGDILGDVTMRSTPVSFKMGAHETELVFWDFPGGFYSQAMIDRNLKKNFAFWSREDVSQWENIIRNADVVLLAVDATTQLGTDPYLADKTYYPRITKLVKESIATSMTTLIFVPVKCEHLALEPEYDEMVGEIDLPFSKTSCGTLREEVERLFPELVEHVQDPSVWGNVDAFFAPMITVGGIKYTGRSRFDPQRCCGTLQFSPVVPEHYDATKFHPMNCDKIFAMCLLRAYAGLVADWRKNASIWAKLLATLKGKTPFEVFFEKLADAIGFNRLFGTFFANHPAFLRQLGESGARLQEAYEQMAQQGTEDGCATMNVVYHPTKIPARN